MIIGLALAPFVALTLAAQTSQTLYLDPNQPVDKRVQDLISRLTLEEKATLLNKMGDVPRLGIRGDQWNQCLHGVVWEKPTTMFPVSIAMAATWDTALVHEVSTAISDEARAIYNWWHDDPNFEGTKKGLFYRAPVINICRNPYWGRNNEAFGEDPFLTGRMAVAYVKGLQGDDPKYLKLVSTLKHFAVNNVENGRQSLSATVSERMLHEYWLPHFRDAIVEGHAQSVMASYNAINGVPNNMNKLLLTDILKHDWQFDGFVVSDLGGVRSMVNGHEKGKMTYEEAVAKSLAAGCDFSDDEFQKYIPAAVRQGLLPEARLDDALARVLRDRIRLGEFDPAAAVPYSRISRDVIDSPEHRKLALRTARESMVLLTNKNNLLPLDKSKIKRIAVIGPHADMFTAGGYSGKATDPVTPLEGIRRHAAQGTEILYAAGARIAPAPSRGKSAPLPPFDTQAELRKAVDAAKQADVAIVYVGTTLAIEAEGRDRKTLALADDQVDLVKAVVAANPRTIVVELNAGPLATPWIKQNVPAMLEAWWNGEEGGDAIADVLFGSVNPAGRLPLTVYESDSQEPPQDEYDVTKGFTYMYLTGRPLFAFGHGLSYTQFKYSNLRLSSNSIKSDGTVSVSVDIWNIGKRTGDEVVQLYVHEVNPVVKRPIEELRGFARISLDPDMKRTVTLDVPAQKLSFYDERVHAFVVNPGAFDVMVGAASDDIRLKGRVNVYAAGRPGGR